MNFNTSIYILLLFCLMATACKAPQIVQHDTVRPLPASYAMGSDSSNVAAINWQEYFSDESLIQLIDEALKNNLDALIALQRIKQTRASVLFHKGKLLPAIEAGGAASINRYGLYTMDGSGNITTEILPGQIVPVNLPDFYVGFQTSWEADITGKLRNRKKAAVARYLATTEGRNWVVTNLVADVARTYYELLSLDNELNIIRETIALQENALSIVTIQKQAGAANELAVKQFQAQVLNTKSLEVAVLQQIVETENRINSLLGRFPQPIPRDSSALERNIPTLLYSGVPNDLLRNRPDIKQSELELVAAKADLKAARAAFYPSLNIIGDIGFQAFKASLLFSNPESFVFGLAGGLSAPLLNRSAIKAEFNAANALQIEAMYNYQKSVLNAYVEVYNELTNLDNLRKMSSFRNEEVNTLLGAIEVSSELFTTGRATYLEVLLTQQNLLNARLDYINVQKNQLLSIVSIYKVLGGGWR